MSIILLAVLFEGKDGEVERSGYLLGSIQRTYVDSAIFRLSMENREAYGSVVFTSPPLPSLSSSNARTFGFFPGTDASPIKVLKYLWSQREILIALPRASRLVWEQLVPSTQHEIPGETSQFHRTIVLLVWWLRGIGRGRLLFRTSSFLLGQLQIMECV